MRTTRKNRTPHRHYKHPLRFSFSRRHCQLSDPTNSLMGPENQLLDHPKRVPADQNPSISYTHRTLKHHINLETGEKLAKKTLTSKNIPQEPFTSFDILPDARELRGIKYLYKNINCLERLGEIREAKASIIMPTFNRCKDIVAAISSVLCQTHQNLELIIVDDGSTDSTQVTIEKSFNDKRIIYKKTMNHGVSHARNIGLRLSSGKFIFFLDSDNSWASDYVRNMVIYLNSEELDNAYCYSAIYKENNKIDCATKRDGNKQHIAKPAAVGQRSEHRRCGYLDCQCRRVVSCAYCAPYC